MANGIVTRQISTADSSVIQCTWLLTTADPIGAPCSFPEWADHTWAVGLTADTLGGATVSVQGGATQADTDFYILSNAAGSTPATFTAFGIKTTIENPLFLRPKLTAVGIGASITVILLARRATGVNRV